MSAAENLKRQWLPLSSGTSDVRMGYNALDQAATIFAAAVGTPRRCMVVVRSSLDEELCELVRRQLVDAGFEVRWHVLEQECVRTLDEANRLMVELCKAELTKDDLCCSVGDTDVLSLVAYACGLWCAGMPFVAIPLSEVALLEGALAPRALDVDEKREMVQASGAARHVLIDYDLMLSDVASESSHYARVLMAGAATASSERDFSDLWDRADALAAGDEETYLTQLLAAAKTRGQALASTAAVVRQSVEYGQSFARAVECAAKTRYPRSLLVAEGMRFAARLSVGLEKLEIDDMLAQDELLDMLGVDTLVCDLTPEVLVRALKGDAYARSNRFMMLIPYALGRVRLATVPDDMLYEHAAAWCAAHRSGK